MDKKKQETPKRKVVQIKPKPKKEGIDFSKFFNFLSIFIFSFIFNKKTTTNL